MSAQGASLNSYKRIACFQYDVAVDGGTTGTISVTGTPIPAGSIITSGVVHVKTAVEGTSSTLAIQALSSGDILAATAEASLTLNALLDTVADGTATNMIRCTSAVTALTFTVGVADITAGKVVVWLEYMPVIA